MLRSSRLSPSMWTEFTIECGYPYSGERQPPSIATLVCFLMRQIPCADPTGDRTSSLITRYSMYLLPIPMAAAALDATSWMFAVEGTAFNACLLYQAYRFGKDRTNANARGVFKASLWHLPAVLALFVFHSQQWVRDEDTLQNGSTVGVREIIQRTRTRLREACVHEVLHTDTTAALCPAVIAEEGAEKAKRTAAAVQKDDASSL
ncbi:unnamed protein product [Sphacelaria rigidula]